MGIQLNQIKKTSYGELNFLERYAIRQSHPVTFILHVLSLLWGAYFLWSQELLLAVGGYVLGMGLGQVIAKSDRGFILVSKNRLNLFQQLIVYHVDIRNLLFQVLAFALYLIGFWIHDVLLILSSISCVLLGYIFPWLRKSKDIHIQAMSLDD